MKFEFCGKGDCPEWIMGQLFSASKLDSARLEAICAAVCRTLGREWQLDEMELFKRLNIYDQRGLMAADFDIDDARAMFAALTFIMENTLFYRVATEQLRGELEQLGLASEQCEVVCRTLDEARVGGGGGNESS